MKTLTALFLAAASAASAATEETLSRTFPVTGDGTLVIDVTWGAIEVVAEPYRTEVGIDVWRKVARQSTTDEERFLKDHPVVFTQDGNKVTVGDRGQRTTRNLLGGWHNRNEGRYTVRVPEKFSATLTTSGGEIAVTGLVGSLKAETSGGALRFTRIHGSITGETSGGGIKLVESEGEIRIETSGGSIDVSGGGGSLVGESSGGGITVKTFAGPVSIETSGGGITLESIRGKIHGETSGGPIRAVLVSPIPGDVDLETSGGGITVTVPADAAFNLDAQSSGGSVTCDLPLTTQGKIKPDHAVGTVNAGGHALRLSTSGGGVHVRTN